MRNPFRDPSLRSINRSIAETPEGERQLDNNGSYVHKTPNHLEMTHIRRGLIANHITTIIAQGDLRAQPPIVESFSRVMEWEDKLGILQARHEAIGLAGPHQLGTDRLRSTARALLKARQS